MSKELIDPLNPDTFDDRVIVHSGIRSTFEHIPQDRWNKVFGWKFYFVWRWYNHKWEHLIEKLILGPLFVSVREW